MIEWVKTNWIQILALWGFLCGAARIIVALTPTPKDNIALYKISLWLKTLAKAFGLDITQGVTGKKYADTGLVLLLCCLLLIGGCSPAIQRSPKAQLCIAQNTFIGLLSSLASMREAGVFSDEELVDITGYVDRGYQALVMWQEGVLNETGNTLKWEAAFSAILNHLIRIQIEKENR